jgi:PAS domain S-box-containing protein
MFDPTNIESYIADRDGPISEPSALLEAVLGGLEDADLGVLVWEGERVDWANETMARLLGVDGSELAGTTESAFTAAFEPEIRDASEIRTTAGESPSESAVRLCNRAIENSSQPRRRVELYRGVGSEEGSDDHPEASSNASRRRGSSAPVRSEQPQSVGRQEALTDSIFDVIPDVLYTLDCDGSVVRWNDEFGEVTGYTDAEIAEMEALDVSPPDDHESVALAISDVLERNETRTIESKLVTKSGEHIPYEFTGARVVDDDGTVLGLTGVGRDVAARKERERRLQRQRDELRRLNRINTIVREIDRGLVEAETRDEIEEALVERLVDADPYRFAVVGEFDPTFDTFTPRAHAGDESGFDAIDELSSDRPLEDGPGAKAVKRGTVQVVQDLEADQVDPWNQFSDGHGFEAVASVPLVANERVYGVLGLFAEEADAFDDRERKLLGELGRNVGNSIHDVETRRLLFADSVVELEFLTWDADIELVALSRHCDCRLELQRSVPVDDEFSLLYVDVYGESADGIRRAARSDEDVRNARVVVESEEFLTLELEVHGDPFTGLFVEYGARTRSFVADEGRGRMVVDVASGRSVRRLVEAVTSTYPSSTLVAKRERDERHESAAEFHERVESSWTERQQAAVQAAFYAGYFEWPRRESSAAEVADSFGVAPQTFHQHLRVAQNKLLTAFFEGSGER